MVRVAFKLVALASVLLGVVSTTSADMLVLKDGTVIQGDFVGGSDAFIQFKSQDTVRSYPLHQVTSLNLTPRPESGTAAVAAPFGGVVTMGSVSSEDSPPPGSLLIPAGTKLLVNFKDKLSSKSHKPGAAFQAVLERDLAVDGGVAAPKGSTVHGRVVDSRGGKKLGAQYLKLTLTSISIHNQKVPILTDAFGVEAGGSAGGKIVGPATMLPPGQAGGEPDTESLIDRDHVQIPEGTILEVPIKEAVAVTP